MLTGIFLPVTFGKKLRTGLDIEEPWNTRGER